MTETPENTDLSPPERSVFRRYLWAWVALMLAGLVFVFWHTCLRWAPLRVSKSTTYFTGPIDPATGRLDLEALAAEVLYRDIPPEENGFLLYHRKGEDGLSPAERFVSLTDYLYKALPDFSLEERQWACRITGLDEKQFQKMVENKADVTKVELLGPISMINEFREQRGWDKRRDIVHKIVDYLQNNLWKPEDVALMQKWCDVNAEPLTVLVEGLRYKEFLPTVAGRGNLVNLSSQLEVLDLSDSNLTVVYSSGSDNLSEERAGLLVRSRYHLGRGDLDAAWDDLFMALLLDRSDYDLCVHALEFVEQNDLTPEQCRRFLAELDRVTEFPCLTHLDVTRIEIFGHIDKLVAHINVAERSWDNIKEDPRNLFLGAIDWNIVYREAWRVFDRTVEILQTPGLDALERKKLATDYLDSFSPFPEYKFSMKTLTVRSRSRIIGNELGEYGARFLLESNIPEQMAELRKILTRKLAEAEQTAGKPEKP